MSARLPIMAHTVLGYPTPNESFDLIETYIHSGVDILELQLPFSDPSADGALITEANQTALAGGATTDACWSLLKKIRVQHPGQQIMLMSYANKIHHIGIKVLESELQALSIRHLIIPDLPIDTRLSHEIHQTKYLQMIPVLAANITGERIDICLKHKPEFIYIMANFSTTGQKFSLHEDVQVLIEKIRKRSDAQIGVGFGISEKKHLEALRGIADFAIVGSSFLTAYKNQRLKEKLEEMLVSS